MNDETLDKAVWHILAQQMTHAINCEDPKHRKAMSCVAFTAGAHVEMMQLIKQDREMAVREARIDELEIITDHYTPYRPFLDDDKNVNIRRYCTDRIAKLSKEQSAKNAHSTILIDEDELKTKAPDSSSEASNTIIPELYDNCLGVGLELSNYQASEDESEEQK